MPVTSLCHQGDPVNRPRGLANGTRRFYRDLLRSSGGRQLECEGPDDGTVDRRVKGPVATLAQSSEDRPEPWRDTAGIPDIRHLLVTTKCPCWV
ncbi:hypothetical protein BaRGS_00009184 [Batillaria attramentaria]|uniref:Uncharacterized protein n=1 Tax=Batillaria attramentaria TaxID=370345 RepID=A0ABD0LJ24_9CAEN